MVCLLQVWETINWRCTHRLVRVSMRNASEIASSDENRCSSSMPCEDGDGKPWWLIVTLKIGKLSYLMLRLANQSEYMYSFCCSCGNRVLFFRVVFRGARKKLIRHQTIMLRSGVYDPTRAGIWVRPKT